MANEKWSTWASMGALAGTEKLVGLDGSANEYTTPADIQKYIGLLSFGIIDGTLTGTNPPTYNRGISASVERMSAGVYEVTLSQAVSNMMPQATAVTGNDVAGGYGGHAQCIVNSSTKFTIYCLELRVGYSYVDANPIRFTVHGGT